MTKPKMLTKDMPNVTLRALPEHMALVHAAREARGYDSVNTYLQHIVLPQAARDCGAQPPDLTVYETEKDVIAAAAEAAGLTPKELATRATRELATRILAEQRAKGSTPLLSRGASSSAPPSDAPGPKAPAKGRRRRRSG